MAMEKPMSTKKVTIINPKDKYGPRFTFKGGPECVIIFDSVRLWDCQVKIDFLKRPEIFENLPAEGNSLE